MAGPIVSVSPITDGVLALAGAKPRRSRNALRPGDLEAAKQLLRECIPGAGPKKFSLSEDAKTKGKSVPNFGVFTSGQGSLSGGRLVSYQVQASITEPVEGVSHPVSRDQRKELVDFLLMRAESLALKPGGFSSGTVGYFLSGNVYFDELGTVSYAMRVSGKQ